ncbi:MAG: efflux RND transporter periplasmic adaptor subunit [Bacteroidia bacterium]|nr:efflux RND transporter periplasmic adaptor subunit [Bacteroidia bacterium]
MKAIQLELGTIEKKQLTASLKANGLLSVPNNNKATVNSLFGGIVTTILVQTGNNVSKDQTIATLANSEFIVMQEEYLSTVAKAEFAQLEYDRQLAMKEENATSLKSFQQAESELKSLNAKQASLKARLILAGLNPDSLSEKNISPVISIKSPISGAISKINVNIGSLADANTSIAEIVDNSQLHLDLYVYEKDLKKLAIGQTIHFTLTNNPGKEYDADIYSISNTFEPNTKAVAVHATVKGDKHGLIDGMSITALVSLDQATVDAVPVKAIVNYDGLDYIFIVKDSSAFSIQSLHNQPVDGHLHQASSQPVNLNTETTFKRILIRKGTTDVGYSEITLLEDVPPGSWIVTNGAFFLMAKITNQGEEHEH